MLKAQIIGGQAAANHLRGVAPNIVTALDKRIMALTYKLQGKVKSDKLTGQVLNVKTGRLRRSINARFEGQGTGTSAGYVGTNVVYARAHEYGCTDAVNVKEHLRMQVMAFGKSINPKQVTVRAHQMKMNFPERSFLRSALDQMRPEVLEQLQQAVTEGIKA